jgi:hypothetical protein
MNGEPLRRTERKIDRGGDEGAAILFQYLRISAIQSKYDNKSVQIGRNTRAT